MQQFRNKAGMQYLRLQGNASSESIKEYKKYILPVIQNKPKSSWI